ncbi:AmiS/UreI family transporter [Phreatobacter stygius]|uniref:Transporter n=1 Tax=Phreatobacter stygius TaxID=1940610 RepID=A0A4D7ARI6_9HYPH|nr:AmiS/UreI family transporter [Phreatobacter stygius]QCI63984.1 transporter [Phreatobacter stygius]
MLLGLNLLYVGAVLFLNGLWLLGKVDDKEIVVINIVSGFVTLCVSLSFAFGPGANAASIKAAALILLFTTTYLWVAYNRFVAVDGRGLGWFSLFVAITVTPISVLSFTSAQSTIDVWLGFNWAIWAIVWFMFFLLLALKRPIQHATGFATLAAGVVTGWLPGFLLLQGKL